MAKSGTTLRSRSVEARSAGPAPCPCQPVSSGRGAAFVVHEDAHGSATSAKYRLGARVQQNRIYRVSLGNILSGLGAEKGNFHRCSFHIGGRVYFDVDERLDVRRFEIGFTHLYEWDGIGMGFRTLGGDNGQRVNNAIPVLPPHAWRIKMPSLRRRTIEWSQWPAMSPAAFNCKFSFNSCVLVWFYQGGARPCPPGRNWHR